MDINKKTRKEKRNTVLNQTPNLESIKENFQILEEKLDYAQKQLSAWDFYKISQTISNDDEYQLKLNMLLPNTSAVVAKKLSNANPGDIFFKDSTYNIHYIQADRGGMYYPKRIERPLGESTYKISYQFLNKEPSVNTNSSVNLNEDAQPAWTISFEGLGISNQTRYGETQLRNENGQCNFETIYSNNITPVFKSFTLNNEEIYWDLVWGTDNEDKFIIENIPSIIHHIVLK